MSKTHMKSRLQYVAQPVDKMLLIELQFALIVESEEGEGPKPFRSKTHLNSRHLLSTCCRLVADSLAMFEIWKRAVEGEEVEDIDSPVTRRYPVGIRSSTG